MAASAAGPRADFPVEALTSQRALDILERAAHTNPSEWLFFRELRVGTGRRNQSLQRLDAFALNCLPHLAMKRVCYEVKTSRADFRTELGQPLKRRVGLRYSNEFYFVAPGGMLPLVEVPPECGLIEVGVATFEEWRALFRRRAGFFAFDAKTGEYCLTTIPAPWRETPGPTWEFVAAMLRNQRREFEDRPPEPRAQQKLQF